MRRNRSWLRPGRSRLRIGLAISRDRITAIARGGPHDMAFDAPFATNGGETSALPSTLVALARRIAGEFGEASFEARVHVALLAPHCDARLVALPPLRASEAMAVLRRDAARHFVGGTGARVVTVQLQPHQEAGTTAPMLAAAAPLALLEMIRDAVQNAGWQLERIVPAQGAWIAGLPADVVKRARGERCLIVATDSDAVHVLDVGAGVRDMRRVPSAWVDEFAAAVGKGPGVAIVHASGVERDRLVRVLAASGWRIDGGDQAMDSGAAAAAECAHLSAMELTPPTLAADRRRRQRQFAVRAAAAGVALLAGVAVAELWGARRELDAIRARRAAIHDEVTPLMAARDSVARLQEWTGRITTLDEQSPRWSRALFDIAMLLPEDAHLTLFQTSGDTLRAEIEGLRAGEALQSLRPAASLTSIRMEGVVERDLEEGTTSTERFRFMARLTAPQTRTDVPVATEPGPVARRTP